LEGKGDTENMNTRDKDREKKKGKENHCSVAEIPTAGTTTGILQCSRDYYRYTAV